MNRVQSSLPAPSKLFVKQAQILHFDPRIFFFGSRRQSSDLNLDSICCNLILSRVNKSKHQVQCEKRKNFRIPSMNHLRHCRQQTVQAKTNKFNEEF